MTTTISAGGLLEIPEVFRKADALQPGQCCEIERVGPGDYRLRVRAAAAVAPPQESLVALLRSCPVKGFFEHAPSSGTTDDLQSLSFE